MTEPKAMDQTSTDVSNLSGSNWVHINSNDGSHVKQSSVPNGCVRHIGNDNGLIVAKTISSVSPSEKANDIDVSPATEKADPDRDSAVDDTSKSKETNSESQADSVSEAVESAENVEDSLSDTLAKASLAETDTAITKEVQRELHYVVYESEHQMPDIMRLITKDLSEPYSIYTYRYFIHNWPKLCFLAMDGSTCVGAIVCKLDLHKKMVRRGYIAMLAIDQNYRRRGIGSHLVMKAIRAMVADDCDEVVLETEITNKAALRLYENLGFVRDKRLFRYYLNGVDALRLKLWLR